MLCRDMALLCRLVTCLAGLDHGLRQERAGADGGGRHDVPNSVEKPLGFGGAKKGWKACRIRPQAGVAWGKFSDDIQRTGWWDSQSMRSYVVNI